MNKKGVELSMNVIIIAAIGLLVLVILAVLVINSTSKLPGTVASCNVKGGICRASCPTDQPMIPATEARCDTGVCCKQFTATG
jgi:hypothetical protein